ncbi:S24 family peptidase [Fibrella sp. ES10-3-2-2]
MTESVARLRQLMEEDNLRQVDLAEKTGYTKATISAYVKEDGEGPSRKFLKELERKLMWSANWVESGAGPKRLTKQSQSQPANRSGAPEYSRKDGSEDTYQLTMAEDTDSSYSPYNASERTNGGKSNMWVVPAKAQAGFIKGFMRRVFSHQIQKVSFPMIQGECFCFEVEGFSMYPMYLPNSFVVCTILEDWEWMRKGKAYVYQTDEGISVKLFDSMEDGQINVSSDNPSYNPVTPFKLNDVRQVYVIEYKIDKD